MPPNNGHTNGQSRILDPQTGLPYTESDPRGGPASAFGVPHVLNFSSALNSQWKLYYHTRFDEAMRAGRTEVTAMKRDAFLMGVFFERRYKVMSQKLSIEVENERDPWQKAIKAGLTQIIRNTPRFRKLLKALYWGVWDGRAGAQVAYHWRTMEMPDGNQTAISTPGGPPVSSSGTGRSMRKSLCIRAHQPLQGDKITHHWDGTPVVLVNRALIMNVPGVREEDIVNTELGAGLILRGTWRQRYIIHAHEWLDADFFDVEEAEAIHGVGIRHFVYWLNTLRLEWLSNVADWCERTGLGVRLWYYQGGNAKSKSEVERAANQQSDRTNIIIPRYGDRAVEGVDYIDTASNGADLLLRLQQHLEDIIERFIIGQTLSAHTEGHGLGGSGVAAMHQDTKSQIIEDDAIDLGETLQEDWLRMVLRFTWPEHKDLPFRLVPNVDKPNAMDALAAIKTFVDMGGKVRTEDARGVLGLPAPEDGDEILQRQEPMDLGMGGMPGDGGMGGALDEPMTPEEQSLSEELFGETDSEDSDAPTPFAKAGQPSRYAFDEAKHHRGQPENAGEFGPGGGSKKTESSGSSSGHSTPQTHSAIQGESSAGNAAAVSPHNIAGVGDRLLQLQQSGKYNNLAVNQAWQKLLVQRYGEIKKNAVAKHGEGITGTVMWGLLKGTFQNHRQLKDPHLAAKEIDLVEQSANAGKKLGNFPSTFIGGLQSMNTDIFAEPEEDIDLEPDRVKNHHEQLKDLSDNFKDIGYHEIEPKVNALIGHMSKDDVLHAARTFRISTAKSKKEAISKIVQTISQRKASWDRTKDIGPSSLNATLNLSPQSMLHAAQESHRTGRHISEVAAEKQEQTKYQRILSDGFIETVFPEPTPEPVKVETIIEKVVEPRQQPVVVNVGETPPDEPRTVVIRDDNGLVLEIQKFDGDRLLSTKTVERDDRGMVKAVVETKA